MVAISCVAIAKTNQSNKEDAKKRWCRGRKTVEEDFAKWITFFVVECPAQSN
jgi:hypothetical protein